MLHTLVRGGSLLATIHRNLLTKDMIRNAPNLAWGKPIWEQMPQDPDDPLVAETTTTYLGRLTPIPRAIKLHNEDTKITLANGCSYPKLPHRESAATVIRRGRDEELAYLGIDLSKHPWRELGLVLALSRSSLDGGAWVLCHLGDSEGEVDLWTGGLAAKQGKVLDVAEWTFHLPLALVGGSALNKYREGVELANRASRRLQAAITAYFEDLAVASSSAMTDPAVSNAGGFSTRLVRATGAAWIRATAFSSRQQPGPPVRWPRSGMAPCERP